MGYITVNPILISNHDLSIHVALLLTTDIGFIFLESQLTEPAFKVLPHIIYDTLVR
jgi:hypothetical protein